MGDVKKGDDTAKQYFAEEDFSRNNAGFKNVRVYMGKMRADYEKIFHNLESDDGNMLLRHDIQCTWPELLVRSQSYFRRYLKGHPHFNELTKDEQQKPYPGLSQIYFDVF